MQKTRHAAKRTGSVGRVARLLRAANGGARTRTHDRHRLSGCPAHERQRMQLISPREHDFADVAAVRRVALGTFELAKIRARRRDVWLRWRVGRPKVARDRGGEDEEREIDE